MNKSKTKTTDLTRQVMNQINTGKVTMRPKAYFIAGSLLLGLGFAGVLVSGTMFTALSSYHFRTFGSLQFLRFGPAGVGPFINAVPWVPLLITILSFYGGLKLLKRYDISYKKNFLALAIGLIFATIIVGLIIDRLDAHRPLRQFAPAKPLFRQHFVHKQYIVGQVTGTAEQEYSVATPNGQQVTVQTNDSTHYPFGQDIQIGDTVHVVGHWQEDVFQAKGIGKDMHRFPTKPPFPSGYPGSMHRRGQ